MNWKDSTDARKGFIWIAPRRLRTSVLRGLAHLIFIGVDHGVVLAVNASEVRLMVTTTSSHSVSLIQEMEGQTLSARRMPLPTPR